jgi:hypothetical protein
VRLTALSAHADIGVNQSAFTLKLGRKNMGNIRTLCRSAIVMATWNGLSALATVFDSDGSSTNVQYIHNTLAQDGDTIALPVGTFSWSTPVSFTKAVNIQGAGTDQTVIYDNVPKPNGSQSMVMFTATVDAGKSLRVTGFTIRGEAQDTQNYNKGTLNFWGNSQSVRVDHVNIILGGTSGIHFGGNVCGVVDHCTHDGSNFKQFVSIDHGNWNGDTAGWGDGSYEDTLHLGTARAVYIEDCICLNETTAGVIDGTRGGRFVFRHNTVTNAFIGMHGTEGFRGRGMRSYEIYQNTFLNPNAIIFTGILARSGTGVIWGNTFSGGAGQTGYKNGMMFTVYRDFTCGGVNEAPPWGNATGSNPWDGNTLSNGYPALDQVGHGTCQDQIRGDNPVNMRTGTPAWPTQALEPVYEWNDTWTPVPENPGNKVTTQCDIVQLGRDILTDTPMPGYTPYTYPHPLTVGGPSPSPTPTPTPSPTSPPSPTPSPTPTSTPAATPTATPTPTATATATSTATPQPSSTPTSTPTATATPTATGTPRHSPKPHPSHGPVKEYHSLESKQRDSLR